MIIKKFKRNVLNRTKEEMIGGLVDYIFAPVDPQGREKIVLTGERNFITTTVKAQKQEMIALAMESVRSKMPVIHGRHTAAH